MIARLKPDEVEAVLTLAGVRYQWLGFKHGTGFYIDYFDSRGGMLVLRQYYIPIRNGKVYPGDVEEAIRLATTPPNQPAHS